MEENIKRLKETIENSNNIVFFGGAGKGSKSEIEHRWVLMTAGVYRKDKEA